MAEFRTDEYTCCGSLWETLQRVPHVPILPFIRPAVMEEADENNKGHSNSNVNKVEDVGLIGPKDAPQLFFGVRYSNNLF